MASNTNTRYICPSKNRVHCSVCDGPHITDECPEVIVTRELRRARIEAERIAKEKEEAERIAKLEAERIAKEKEKAEKWRLAKEKAADERATRERMIAEGRLRESDSDSGSQGSYVPKKDTTLELIFNILCDRRASMEWVMLTEHYRKHSEAFRCVGASHESNRDGQPHVTLQVSYKFKTRKSGDTMVWYRSYHIYYHMEGLKTIYDFVTATDRDDKRYTLCSFT
jgi:hypothetical protein